LTAPRTMLRTRGLVMSGSSMPIAPVARGVASGWRLGRNQVGDRSMTACVSPGEPRSPRLQHFDTVRCRRREAATSRSLLRDALYGFHLSRSPLELLDPPCGCCVDDIGLIGNQAPADSARRDPDRPGTPNAQRGGRGVQALFGNRAAISLPNHRPGPSCTIRPCRSAGAVHDARDRSRGARASAIDPALMPCRSGRRRGQASFVSVPTSRSTDRSPHSQASTPHRSTSVLVMTPRS